MNEITLNDRYLNVLSVCNTCKHFDVFEFTCPAFPKGIPDEFLAGKSKHDEIVPGQTGMTIFEER